MRFHGNGAPKLSRTISFGVPTYETPGDKGGGTGDDKDKEPPGDKDKGKGKDDEDDEPKLTQKQVNAIVKKRAEDLIKQALGVDTLDAAKAAIAAGSKAAEDAKTEGEKARDKAVADALAAERQKHADELARIQADSDRRTIESEVRSTARELNFHDPEDAWLRVADQVGEDDSPISIEDGKVKGVKEALEKLAKDKPYLVKSEKPAVPGTPNPGGGGNGSLSDEQRMERGAREIAWGRRSRR